MKVVLMKYIGVITIENKDEANTIIRQNITNPDGSDVGDVFRMPYSADGSAPATHYIFSWNLENAKQNTINGLMNSNFGQDFSHAIIENSEVRAWIDSQPFVLLND